MEFGCFENLSGQSFLDLWTGQPDEDSWVLDGWIALEYTLMVGIW
jgi:hypothetical protein